MTELIKIIDAQVHYSPNDIDFFGEKINAEILTKSLNISEGKKYIVEKAALSNLEGIDTLDHVPGRPPLVNEIECNLDAVKFCNENPRFLPLAVCQPGYGNVSNIENLMQNHKFYGLKFHSYYLGLNANHYLYDPYIKLAHDYKLPCLFHTANGNSSPELVYDLAKRFPKVPFVLYHSNFESDHLDALEVAKKSIDKNDADLYLEISWVDQKVETEIILDMIKKLGIKKILFGTDASLGEYSKFNENGEFAGNINYLNRIENIVNLINKNFDSEERFKVINSLFYGNSKNLFSL